MIAANRVDWTIAPQRCALLLHDMQPHYLAALPGPERERLLSAARMLISAASRAGVPLFASHVPSQHGRERGLMRDMWGAGPGAGEEGLDPALGLADEPVRMIAKRSYSAFFGNDFELLLRRLGRDQLLIAGVYTSIGCQATGMDAFMRDIRPFFVTDALADLTPEDHRAGLRQAARTCARLVDAETACVALRRRADADDRALTGIDVC